MKCLHISSRGRMSWSYSSYIFPLKLQVSSPKSWRTIQSQTGQAHADPNRCLLDKEILAVTPLANVHLALPFTSQSVQIWYPRTVSRYFTQTRHCCTRSLGQLQAKCYWPRFSSKSFKKYSCKTGSSLQQRLILQMETVFCKDSPAQSGPTWCWSTKKILVNSLHLKHWLHPTVSGIFEILQYTYLSLSKTQLLYGISTSLLWNAWSPCLSTCRVFQYVLLLFRQPFWLSPPQQGRVSVLQDFMVGPVCIPLCSDEEH